MLGQPEGTPVTVHPAKPPASLGAVHRKIAGERLSYEDYAGIARDIVDYRYSKIEMAAFLVAWLRRRERPGEPLPYGRPPGGEREGEAPGGQAENFQSGHGAGIYR